jgi:hypothetical protein
MKMKNNGLILIVFVLVGISLANKKVSIGVGATSGNKSDKNVEIPTDVKLNEDALVKRVTDFCSSPDQLHDYKNCIMIETAKQMKIAIPPLCAKG